MSNRFRAVVIGGGPAGLTAAAALARRLGRNSVALLEKQKRMGRKLLATGNGRCNISNKAPVPERYHGDRLLAEAVLSQFSAEDMKLYLRELGVLVRTDGEGRVYPRSNQASSVLRAMEDECRRQGVEFMHGSSVQRLCREKKGWRVEACEQVIYADAVVMATGLQASPALGADESGLALLTALGMRPGIRFPSLCPVRIKEKITMLKGVRAKGRVALLADGTLLAVKSGEIQFTENALSGICVFELSRMVNEFFAAGSIEGKVCRQIQIEADVLPELSFQEINLYLTEMQRLHRNRDGCMLLAGALPEKLSQWIAGSCGLSGKTAGALRPAELKKLAGCAKKLVFTPAGASSFQSAQVSAGGFSSAEVNPDTLMCRRFPDLFLCGELLDVDGDCGGFNLHFAVGSGLTAGREALR